MLKKSISSVLVSCTLLSCIQVRGLTDDYNKLTAEQKTLVQPFRSNTILTKGKVYKINATELLEELREYPKAIVYIFTVGCPADSCLPLPVYEAYARANGYKIFFVMTSYKDLDEALDEPISEPLFVIDSDYYGKKYFRKYVDYFKNELQGRDRKSKEVVYDGGIHFFEHGIYKNTATYLPDN